MKTIWIDNSFIRDINMDLFERFITFIEALNKEDVDYILVGGYAVILYGMPRMTQDINIIARLGEAFCYEDIAWDSKEIDGHMVRIRKAETL